MPVPIPNLNQLQIIPPQPATAKLQAMEFMDRQRRTGIAEDRNAILREGQDIQREGQSLQRESFEFEKMKQNLMLGKEYLPTLKKDEYGKYRKWVESIGAPEVFLPSETEVAGMSDSEFEGLKSRLILGSDNIAKMSVEDYKSALRQYEESQKQKDRIEIEELKGKKQIELEKLKEKLKTPGSLSAAWLKNHPNPTDAEILAFNQGMKGKGEKITVGPDGSLIIERGGAQELSVKTKGTIEEKLLGGQEQYQRMSAIADNFKPEFQEVGFRLSKAWTGIQARLGQDVPEEDKKSLVDFKQYQRKSIENINLYIKEMTGAQMSEKEADRLRLAQPDPGEKWYQGDDPITFKAKMDDVLKYSRAAVARYTYYKNKGIEDQDIRNLINSNQAVSLEDIVSGME